MVLILTKIISGCSVKRILHDDPHFQPYKMTIVGEFSECDFNFWINACEVLHEVVLDNAIVFSTYEPHFLLCGSVNKQNMHY